MDHRHLIFFIPVLMLLDYLLTVAGAKLSAKTYGLHFKYPDYELNPFHRKQIAKKQWVSVRHLVMVAVASIFCAYWYVSWPIDDTHFLDEMLFGAIFGVFMTVDGAHLANLLTFQYMNRHPDTVTGEVVMGMPYLLKFSQYLLLRAILPIGAAAYFVRSPFLYGALLGLSALFAAHWVWGLGAKRKSQANR